MSDRPFPDLRRRAAGSQRGFSLLELIVTLAISAVLLGLALPSFRTLTGDSQLSATVNDLVFALQTARSEAIKRAGVVTLCTSATPLAADASCGGAGYGDGWIVYADADGDGVRDAGEEEELILQSGPRSAAFTFPQDGGAYAARVLFTDTGASATPAGTPIRVEIDIDYADGRERRTVVVAANGRVASESPEPATP